MIFFNIFIMYIFHTANVCYIHTHELRVLHMNMHDLHHVSYFVPKLQEKLNIVSE